MEEEEDEARSSDLPQGQHEKMSRVASLSLSVHMIVVVFVVVYLCLSWTPSLCGPGSVLVFTTAACQTLRQPSILTETTK